MLSSRSCSEDIATTGSLKSHTRDQVIGEIFIHFGVLLLHFYVHQLRNKIVEVSINLKDGLL